MAVEMTQVVVMQTRKYDRKPAAMSASAQMHLFGAYKCPTCGDGLAEYQPFAVHMAHAHRKRRVARMYAMDSGLCTVCLQIFSSRARLVDHLAEKNPICMMTTAWCRASLEAEVGAGS